MSFTCFAGLPTELRRKIFEEACHITRILDLWPKIPQVSKRREGIRSDKIIFHTRSRNPPAILHVSHEAREVGLENYKSFFGTHFNRGLGGGPLYLSENPRIYVNWKSDIICPVLGSRAQDTDGDLQRLLIEFVLGFLSRLPFFRIAISLNLIRDFEEKFGHELAWSRHYKEVTVFSMAPVDQRFRSSKPALLKFCSTEDGRDGHALDELSLEIDRLSLAVDDLRSKITANRDRCPALAGPFPPLIKSMIIEFDQEET